MEKLRFPLLVKQIDDDGTFVARAAVYETVDLNGDIIKRGAFTKTIGENPEVPIVWMHNPWEPLGIGQLEDSETGLVVHGKLELEVQRAREVRALMKQGAVKGFSIGYDPIKWSWDGDIRILEEVRVGEVSPVTKGFQAHPDAELLSVKTVVPFQDLPLADEDRAWDKGRALVRVRAWAGATEEPNAKYRKAFLWFDSENADQFGAYKFPIADVIDGTLTAIPRALFAAAARLNQADIPEAEIARVRRHIERYYKKMGRESPFESDDKTASRDAQLERFLRRLLMHGAVTIADMKAGHLLNRKLRQLIIAAKEPLHALVEAAEDQEAKSIQTQDDEPGIHSLIQSVEAFTSYLRGT